MLQANDNNTFHILTVGWGPNVIEGLADRVQSLTGYRFSHILDPSMDRHVSAEGPPPANCFFMRENINKKMPTPDMEYLASLEQPGVPTIHNMILSDRVLRALNYSESLAYASYLAHRLVHLIRRIKPSVIIGGYDGLHGGIALAVSRKMNIPWFALSFTTIPKGFTGFCTGMTPATIFAVRHTSPVKLRVLAERTLSEFEAKRLIVPAYFSANSVRMIVRRLPEHVRTFYRSVHRAATKRHDKYTQYTVGRHAREYLRKRRNMLFLPTHWFSVAPPATPYLFIGLHMQPESSIDVWAPFYSNQFSVIESIARATPPTHQLLVKLHQSDADNYSRRQLHHLRRLPGVRLVSPFASSRTFIENASLVLAIQGNIAFEAALLGRPVLIFGDSKFMEFPSVSKVNRIKELPLQIRSKLSEEPPTREEIVQGLMSYLSCYAPGCYNNWEVIPSEMEIEALADQFKALRDYVEGHRICAE